MSDIVERLRDAAALPTGLYAEAADTIAALRAENEASWKREQRLFQHVAELKAENERLRTLLTDCADDLEAEYAARYPDAMRSQYPSVEQDYQRDMSTVYAARAALGEKGNGE